MPTAFDELPFARARRARRPAWRLAAYGTLGLIVFVGVSFRLLGIAFGLPYHHHWDEGWIVDSVAGMLRHHDDVPASYQYGAPLMRLTELAFALLGAAERRTLDLTPVDTRVTLYLLARIVVALISSTGIVAMFVAARRSDHGPRASMLRGLGSALLYAISSELVFHARYGVTDACLVALTAWTFAFAAEYLARRSLAWGAASVLAAGLTFAFKMPGIVTSLIPALCAAILFVRARRNGRPALGHGILFFAIAPVVLVTYVILNPHVVDRHADAMGDLVGRYRQTRDGGFSSVYLRDPGLDHLTSALGALVTQFSSRSVLVSLAVVAVAAWGALGDLRRRRPLMAVSVAYAVILVLSIAIPNRTFLYRNYLVVLPALCLAFGAGLARAIAATSLRLRHRPIVLSLAGAAVSIALVAPTAADALGAQRFRQDARVEALDWIASRAPAGQPADVATTPSVFGHLALGAYPELRGILRRPSLRMATGELDACPGPDGPAYVVTASYRDTHKTPDDPYREQWLFQQCPGYEQAAAFDSSSHEANLRAYPTWYGRTSAIVLRRVE